MFLSIRQALALGARIEWFYTLSAAFFDKDGTAYYWRSEVKAPTPDSCRWIKGHPGEKGWRYCSEPQAHGSYCAHHAASLTRTGQAAPMQRDRAARLSLADLEIELPSGPART